MKLYSTRDKSYRTDFRTAVRQGLAPDGGLFMPVELPVFNRDFWKELRGSTLRTKARIFLGETLEDDFNPEQLDRITSRAFTFDAPLVPLGNHLEILELFHGPTLAFKDFGARTMAAMLSEMAREEGEKITILTATSGDTGAAVAHGFFEAPGVDVFVFYPAGKVSGLQEKQFTTLGGNVHALEVEGTFDDCQRLVKACFADPDIRDARELTTANSINIARLLPQMVYYIHASCDSNEKDWHPPVFSVPSGNFGNLTAGLMARKMGMPFRFFVAATNCNHVVPDYLEQGEYHPGKSVRTISNAMDVGDPSNFDRMLDLYGSDHGAMAKDVTGAWYTDDQTRNAIVEVWNRHQYLMDPHTAVGYLGGQASAQKSLRTVVLSTAHPSKFPETIEELLPGSLVIPERLARLADRKKITVKVRPELQDVKAVLLS